METSPPMNNGQAQRAALNQYDELLKRVADRDPSAVQEAAASASAVAKTSRG